jgi:hypothetical protein
MNRTALINQVKSKIDELSPSDSIIVSVGQDDNKPIDTIIGDLLDESAKEVLLKAPVHRLTVTSSSNAGTAATGDAKTGTIDIPNDYLRLVELKMTDWLRPVTELVPQGTPLANMQYNKYLRGGLNKPVAVLSHRSDKMVIEYFTIDTKHTVERFLYIKKDVAENVPEILQDALCWICASRVLTIFGKVEGAKKAEDNAISLMM